MDLCVVEDTTCKTHNTCITDLQCVTGIYTEQNTFLLWKTKTETVWMYLKKRTIVWNSKSVLHWFYLHQVWEAFAVGSDTVERKVSWFNIWRYYNKCKKCNRNVFSQCFLHKDRELRRKARAALGIREDIFSSLEADVPPSVVPKCFTFVLAASPPNSTLLIHGIAHWIINWVTPL